MSIINQHITIPKNISTNDDLEFHFLRKEGISYLENLGGKLWTDFNSHDPGITILEMLCYGITDLGMRINTPLEDLLASKDAKLSLQAQFYKASQIFPTKPINELDYRKLFIDLKGVKNCWLRKYTKRVYVDCKNNKLSYKEFENLLPEFQKKFTLKGLYTLLVDLDEGYGEEIFSTIRTAYHANRNLCEDLIEIKKVEEQPIAICANVEVFPEVDEEKVKAHILYEIENYLSPSLNFYGVTHMLDKGYTTDEIFDGPTLSNGFIDDKELKEAELRKEVRLSDVMKIIMNIEGVKLIKDISVGHCDPNKIQQNKWVVCIDPDKKPVLCDKSTFNFSKGFLPLNINENRVAEYLDNIKEDVRQSQKINKEEKELSLPKGTPLDSHDYTTIQNDFPDTYGIGQEGLSVHVTNERRAKAKQLKTYLTFFDQILASYFKHLSEVRTILSVSGEETRSYFTQAVKDIKDFKELVAEYPQSNDEDLTHLLLHHFDNNIERRNSILDHLIARFAERFGEYTFLMKALYGKATDEIVLGNKEAFLKDYIAISRERGSAFNYYKQKKEDLWNTLNVSGFQKRVARLMGMTNERRRNLTETSVEVYDFESGGKTVYRWRIRDNEGNILLSATENYATTSLAVEELYFAVLQIVQTSAQEVEDLVKIEDKTIIGFLRIHTTSPANPATPIKYSFDVINPEKPKNSADYIIAKQYKYYESVEEIKEAILEIISFLKGQFTEEGMFLVEHILLRPDVAEKEGTHFLPICADDCADCGTIDPYSYRVSIVLPGFTYRFSNTDFRRYMEDVIREELPSHILPRICWVGDRKGIVKDDKNDLLRFEKAYKKYLFAKTGLEQEQPTKQNELPNLIAAIQELNTIYPTGRLTDCSAEEEALDGRIILGQSSIGRLEKNKEEADEE
ncbi:hypothetical protein [uncultured Tenacibaculum sp.]|uniref:hypothetical protein n=1 Tax=uncultured Tenacibaculum sp. TaxID=174713 RepID=UPI0026074E4F|nr:hypothetical protein [uncultured Tenacibaculum sp.]